MTDPTTDQPKRGPGRPKGLGKVPGSGRKSGTPNKDRAATIKRIMKESDPIGFLCQVARGVRMAAAEEAGNKKRGWIFPSLDQRIQAAQTLCRKVLPDMKAIEHSGEQVTITKIIREIIDPRAAATEAGNAAHETGNGVADPNAVEPVKRDGPSPRPHKLSDRR